MDTERAQALWIKVQAGTATEAERHEYGQLKTAAYKAMRRGN